MGFVPNIAVKAHLNKAATARVTSIEPVDLLLAVLALAFQQWKDTRECEICFESHGRDLRDESLDVSRMVGCFTAIQNIVFSTLCSAAATFNELIAEVKDRTSIAMARMDKSAPIAGHLTHTHIIMFNYHGPYSIDHEEDRFVAVDIGQDSADEDPPDTRFAAMDIGCAINNGIPTMGIIYSHAIHDECEASDLLHHWSECFKAVLEHCQSDTATCILTSRQVKSETLRFLIRCLERTREAPSKPEVKLIAEAATKLLTESVEAATAAGAETLGTLMKIMGERPMGPYLEGVDDSRKTKIKEYCGAAVEATRAAGVYDSRKTKIKEYCDAAEVKAKDKPKPVAPPPKAAPELNACVAAESTTVSTVLRAAWALALAYFYGQEDVVFGATTSGRKINVAGIEEVVGSGINTVPCRIRVRSSDLREIYIREVHSLCDSLVENDTISLHRSYEVSGKHNLFHTTFVYQKYVKFPPEPTMPFTFELVEAKETTDVPLDVMVSKTDSGQLYVSALLRGEHLTRRFLENIFPAFAAALRWLCSQNEAVDSRIGDLILLSPEAQRELEYFSRGTTLQQSHTTVWQLFVRQERQGSERTAIESHTDEHNETLSYGDLLERAKCGVRYLDMEGVRSHKRHHAIPARAWGGSHSHSLEQPR
ncbi:MAG: hypothetical protein Q9180_005092 [Flavoplaca navasiana]